MSNQTEDSSGGRRSRLKQILLVDDDASVRESLSALLTGENYLVLAAENGAQGLQIAEAATMDLVLLDLNMPVKDGWQTLQALSYRHPSTPVVLITARHNQLFPALAAGVAALLEKPMDMPHLLETVRRLAYESPEARRDRLMGRDTTFFHEPRKPGAT
jgi:CheY-like chemotaxis protein